MKKNLFLFACLFLILGCKQNQYFEQYTKRDNQIIEGKGVDSFEVGKTTIDEVIRILGKDYQEIKHNNYSVEYLYEKLGLSFYHYQDKSDKIIFNIHFLSPFKGKTVQGIELNKAIMKDVIQVYGEPNWTSCDVCDTWAVDYDGIKFYVKRNESLPHFPLDVNAHIHLPIIKISVSK